MKQCGADDGAYCYSDFATRDLVPLLGIPHAGDGGVAGGAVASKVCQLVTHCLQWITLGVAVFSVPDGPPLEYIFLRSEEQTNEVGLEEDSIRGGGSVVRVFSNEELDVLDP